jgi:heme/copper-type cytochrome/quinol oxidase subunit 3
MFRPIATEMALFLAPFALYAVFLLATRAGALHPDAWSLPKIALLVIASFTLMLGSFLVLAQFSGAPPGSTYVPAHVQDGKFVPGQTTEKTK